VSATRFAWPAEVLEEPEGTTVTFPDVPGAITWGATRAEAMERAADALVSVFSALIEDGKPVPPPSDPQGRPAVSIGPLDAAKVALHNAMLEAKMSNVELARRMNTDEKAVRRMRDPLHGGRIEKLVAALRILGKRVETAVLDEVS
jgi:antitoxin HicB